MQAAITLMRRFQVPMVCATIAGVLCALPCSAHAQTAFTYQGVLKQNNAPVNGSMHLRFQLWDALSGGTQIGSDLDIPSATLDNGMFTAALDFGTSAFDGSPRWLAVQVVTGGGSTVTTLSPRQAVSPAPYALHAMRMSDGAMPATYSAPIAMTSFSNQFTGQFDGSGAGLTSLNASSLASGIVPDDRLPVELVRNSTTNAFAADNHFLAKVGIGTASPQWPLDVKSDSSENDAQAILGELTNTNGGQIAAAVRGMNRDTNAHGFGVHGSHDGNGIGVRGTALGDSGTGVAGQTSSTTGSPVAVYGFTNSPNGYAGFFSGGRNFFGGNVGIGTLSPSINLALGTDGTGVTSLSSNNLSLFTNYSERLRVSTFGNIGIGTAVPATRLQLIGGTFHAEMSDTSTGARTILGWATGTTGATRGVYGRSDSSNGSAFGVYGLAPVTGFGVYAEGRLAATGTKSFRIDHPLDPANKYLLHYCAESPEPLNTYSGNEITDERGYAVVTLPAYFEAINIDVRYQLTVIDDTDSDDFVLAKIAREVRDNTFVIRTNQPHVKVSWRIEARRNDAWVRAYGAPVEVDKPEGEQGLYQNPELYGLPAELAINPPMTQHPQEHVVALEQQIEERE